MKKALVTLSVASVALVSAAAQAWEAGDMFIRGGLANVSPDASSDPVAIPGLNLGPIPGTSVDVDDNTQLGITFTYMYTDSFGVEVLAATPFNHDISADLTGAGVPGSTPVGETHHLPPTVSAIWYPVGSDQSFNPYLGVGLNYTNFFDTDVDPALESLVGQLAGAPGPVPLDLDLDDSWGIALQAGVDFEIDTQWHVNASIRYIDIGTDANITSGGASIITVDGVDIDPWVYQLNVGYKF